MRSVHSKHLLSFLALPAIALTAFLAAQSSNAIRGDVNNDGQVTTVDALAIMSHVVGKPLPPGYTMVPNGDANGDGQVTAADALVILSYVVGKDVSQYPIGKGIIRVSVEPSTVTLSRGATRQLTASVSGSSNTALAWRSSALGVATVSESGLVTGVAPGEATITVTSVADTLAKATVAVAVTQAAASTISIVSGNQQTTTVGTQLPNALVVRVADAASNPVSGVSVSWQVTSGGGSITQTSTTATNGDAVAIWVLGTTAGAQTVTATVGGQTTTFTATATAGTPAKLEKTGGDAQTGTAGNPLGDSLVVRVADQYDNPVAGVSVTWAASQGNGSVSPQTSTTTVLGLAKARWTVGTVPGEDTVTASAPALPPATFTATVVGGGASKLQKVRGDTQQDRVGQQLPDSLVVRVVDAHDNPVGGAQVTWRTVGRSGQITPATVITDAAGLARATWMLDTIAGADTTRAVIASDSVTFTSTGVAGAVTSVTVSPDSVSLGIGSTRQLGATLRDRYGNQVTGSQVTWVSSDTSKAKISHTGLVTGVGAGATTVTASSQGSSGTARITVSAPNLSIDGVYLTQSVQTYGGSVPLIQGRDGFLRVFVKSDQANTPAPQVRVRFYAGGTLTSTFTIPAPSISAPISINEGNLAASWSLAVPSSLVQPNLSILVDVDPQNQVAEGNESDNQFPMSGSPLALDVRVAPLFTVRFVPVHQDSTGLTGDVTAANKDSFVDVAQRIFPLPGFDADVRATYTTSAPPLQSNNGNGAWTRILSEMNALRTAEGSSRHYYGVVRTQYSSGTAGYGYVPGYAAVGWDVRGSDRRVFAHEVGHNFGRHHVPGCNAGSPDPNYPYPPGTIGVYGYDVAAGVLHPPSSGDIMSYCYAWISDYTYTGVLNFRASRGAGSAGAEAGEGGAQPTLLVWGRITADSLILEPAFEVVTRPRLPSQTGPYSIAGTDADGGEVFSVSFAGEEVDHADNGERHFSFAIPLVSAQSSRVASLRLSGRGRQKVVTARLRGPVNQVPPAASVRAATNRRVALTWDAHSHPMVMVRHPLTGEIISFARGGAASVVTDAQELDLVFSDGVRSQRRRIPVPRP